MYRAKRIVSLDALLAALDRYLHVFDERGIQRRSVSTNIQKAMVWHVLEDYDQALAALEQALSKAESEGYIRSFIDQGAPMKDLLTKAIAAGVKVAYANQLLSAMQADLGEEVTQEDHQPVPLLQPLTRRETEVLRLLATDLTVQEIADQLVIETSTLRTHIKRVYKKLGAHSRFETVTRAKESGLI